MRAARVVAAAAAVALAAVAAPARAGELALPGTHAVLDVPAGWTAHELPGLVAAYRAPGAPGGAGGAGGAALAVTRAPVPNPDAYRARTRDAYLEQIERGFVGAMPNARRTARRVSEVGGVPTLELEARRGDGALVVARILLFRTYALALAIEVPAGASPRDARAIAQGFRPRLP